MFRNANLSTDVRIHSMLNSAKSGAGCLFPVPADNMQRFFSDAMISQLLEGSRKVTGLTDLRLAPMMVYAAADGKLPVAPYVAPLPLRARKFRGHTASGDSPRGQGSYASRGL
ncbi:hypothetical protein [Sphingobium fontiphilum]|nr:hypothetical protein [Sphingobium fontiphilum]